MPENDPIITFPPDHANVMIHFYRGELGRMMVWRQRFDSTTHWALLALTGIVTFGWAHGDQANFIFIFAYFTLYLLLTIEARRYRFYDAYRARVRILESHFIFPVVTQNQSRLNGNWRKMLGYDLIVPSFKITFWEALSRRLRRNYIWMFMGLTGAWLTHAVVVGNATSTSELIDNVAAHQPLNIWLFLGCLSGFHIYLAALYFLGRHRKASGEFQQRPLTEGWSL